MSDEQIRMLHTLANEFETIGEDGHESPPSATLPRSFVVAHLRGLAVTLQAAQEAFEAVKRMEDQS
jgi:hypothetical protein